jgi:hypothetical protein
MAAVGSAAELHSSGVTGMALQWPGTCHEGSRRGRR